ncbi:MAG: hypothetical protein KDC53_21855 [Saprospiraceae bacterium]|nr:hypothetical protein [Saprospiraceae bacterium]
MQKKNSITLSMLARSVSALTSFLSLIFCYALPAQVSEIKPVGSELLEPAFQNSTYEDSMIWSPPADTIFVGFFVPFDSFQIADVIGLPPGINYECDSPDCTWTSASPNQTMASIKLIGNPGTNASAKFPLKIELKYFLTFFSTPQTLTKTDSSMFIFLCPFPNDTPNLEVVNLAPSLNISTNPVTGYYYGIDSVVGTSSISIPHNVLFLSSKDVVLYPPFQVNLGAKFLAGTCPE